VAAASAWRGRETQNGIVMLRLFVAAFDKVAALVSCGLVVALLVCVSLGVVTRSLGSPLIWTDELSRFLMVWLAVFGWILASRKRIQVRIRFFQDLLPRRLHQGIELAIQLSLTLLGALICWFGIGLVGKNHDLEATTLPISMAWMYAPMVLAGLLTAVQGISEAFEVLRRGLRNASGEDGGVLVE
jgi:TRAP-type C4-dicarboxylate transport system permease small subunit